MAFLQEYTMLDELGKGGYATVYKVRHNELGYIRAIRVLNETIVDSTSKTYEKFLRECKVLLRLGNGNHPNIVHIYQPRLLENKALVEMDYVDGMDIQHYLKQNGNFVPKEEVIRMAIQISSALAYCHEDIYRFCMDRDADNLQDDPNDGTKVLMDETIRKRLIDKYKVIHNDIHSGNIMRREDGNFVLLDFGLAISGDEVVRTSRHANGAPEFKAPEKWDNESILTEQSDIYSFGIVLYQYLAGRVPFSYDTSKSAHIAEFELGEAHQKTPPPPIESLRKERYEQKFEGEHYKRDYPQWLEDVIMRCLSKNPGERFRNGRELYECIIAHSQEHNGIGNDVEIDNLTKEKDELADEVAELRNTNHYLADQLQAESHRSPLPNRTNVILIVLLILFGILGGLASWYAYYCPHIEERPVVEPVIVHDTIYRTVMDTKSINELKKQIDDLKFKVELQTKVFEFLSTYRDAEADMNLQKISQLYADNLERYHDKNNVRKSDVLESYRKYDKTFGVKGRHIAVRWNTVSYRKMPDGNVSIVYVEDYNIDRIDKSKYSKFVLEKHLELNDRFKIVSVYDVQLNKSK